ncbi:MAG: flagellar M-ring protein FliF C-terminal domain-containing protein, partial [Bryobacteraceae bacterium]
VMISLRPGAKLSPANGAGICHLVASAVDRLNPESVTVLDTRGNMLVKPRKASTDPGYDQPEADLEYRQKIERDLLAKVNATLEPLLGANRFRAGASVECDFTSGEQNEENYDPAKLVTASVQKTEDTSGPAVTDAGVPGTAANLPRPQLTRAGAATSTSRKTEHTTYQTSKVVRHTRMPQGGLKRISISVLVDQNVRWEGKGLKVRRILEPPSAERMKTIRDVVAAATGISSTRGDLLTVETAPFESTLNLEPPPADPSTGPMLPGAPKGGLPPWLEKYIEYMPLPLRIGIVAAVLSILLAPIAYWIWRLRGRNAARKASARSAAEIAGENVAGTEHNQIPSFEERMALRAAEKQRLDAEALQSLAGAPTETSKAEVLVRYLKNSVGANPTSAAHLIRTWLDEGR